MCTHVYKDTALNNFIYARYEDAEVMGCPNTMEQCWNTMQFPPPTDEEVIASHMGRLFSQLVWTMTEQIAGRCLEVPLAIAASEFEPSKLDELKPKTHFHNQVA